MTSAKGILGVVGTAVGGLIGWSDDDGPGADPDSVRALFADLGVRVGSSPEDLAAALGAFQTRVGLRIDGEAGPQTVHALVRYAKEARDLRAFERLAA